MPKSNLAKIFVVLALFISLAKWISNQRYESRKHKEIINNDQAEEVVLLLKPGAATSVFQKRLNIFLEKKNLRVVQSKVVIFNEEMVRQFYPHSKEKFIPETTEYLASGKVVAMHVTGKDAIDICVKLKKRIRGYLKLKQPANMFHCSGEGQGDPNDKTEVAREKVFFGF